MTIIEEKTLSNDALLTIIDESKKLAADRWLVKLRCLVTIPWSEWMDQYLGSEDGPYEEVMASLGPIEYAIVKERNFIDKGEKDNVLAVMQAMIHENIGSYIDHPDFTQKVFSKLLREWRESKKLKASMPIADEQNVVEEPSDFSGCFR